MQKLINRKWAFALGALLAFPTAWFILISLLKYSLGLPYLYDLSEPLFEKLGIKESLGLNINLLILFGPLLALALNLLSILKIGWYNEKEDFSIKVSIRKHWWNMLVVIISGGLLAFLFVYAVGENYNNVELINFYAIDTFY